MVCNKCKVDCPIEKFDTYFHSTKNKHYTRRICNPCMRLGYREYKLKIKSQLLKKKSILMWGEVFNVLNNQSNNSFI